MGGRAEVVKPGGKMDGRPRKDFQGFHSHSELVCGLRLMHVSLSCDWTRRRKGRRGVARRVMKRGLLLKDEAPSSSPSWTSWRKKSQICKVRAAKDPGCRPVQPSYSMDEKIKAPKMSTSCCWPGGEVGFSWARGESWN